MRRDCKGEQCTYNEDDTASEARVISLGQESALGNARVAVEDLQPRNKQIGQLEYVEDDECRTCTEHPEEGVSDRRYTNGMVRTCCS